MRTLIFCVAVEVIVRVVVCLILVLDLFPSLFFMIDDYVTGSNSQK